VRCVTASRARTLESKRLTERTPAGGERERGHRFRRFGKGGAIIDAFVTSFARRRWGSCFDRAAIATSHLGRGGVLWILLDAIVEARASGRVLATRDVTGAVAVAYTSSIVLARVVKRRRPCHSDGRALIECPDGPGLPSDQTAAAFAAAYTLRRHAPALGPPLYALAGALALARVYCGVHHLTDTIAGAAFGTAVAVAVSARSAR
jgi:membrane-associated phospholipid phosphatase